eukprot:scaffold23068_cov27-Tisochrysis_lutea.AAC.5
MPNRIVAAHGNFDSASVVGTSQAVPIDDVKAACEAGPDGWAELNLKHGGLVRGLRAATTVVVSSLCEPTTVPIPSLIPPLLRLSRTLSFLGRHFHDASLSARRRTFPNVTCCSSWALLSLYNHLQDSSTCLHHMHGVF